MTISSSVKTLWFLTLAVISVSESNVLIKMMWIECAKFRYWHEAHNDTNWVSKIGFTPQRLVAFVVQKAASDKDKVHKRTHTPSERTHTHTRAHLLHTHTSWVQVLQVLTLLIVFDTTEVHRTCTLEIIHWLQVSVRGFLSVVNWISHGYTKPCNTWRYEREFII